MFQSSSPAFGRTQPSDRFSRSNTLQTDVVAPVIAASGWCATTYVVQDRA